MQMTEQSTEQTEAYLQWAEWVGPSEGVAG